MMTLPGMPLATRPSTRSGASSRRCCSQPLFTSCSSGLAARSVSAMALTPLKPITMRSSAWRVRMALATRDWKSGNLAQASSLAYFRCVSKLVCSQRYLVPSKVDRSRVSRSLVLVLVRLAIGPDTPRPSFSPSCSVTPMMFTFDRNSLDSCIFVSSFCCTLGVTLKVLATLSVSFSWPRRVSYWPKTWRVCFFMVRCSVVDWGNRWRGRLKLGLHGTVVASGGRAACAVAWLRIHLCLEGGQLVLRGFQRLFCSVDALDCGGIVVAGGDDMAGQFLDRLGDVGKLRCIAAGLGGEARQQTLDDISELAALLRLVEFQRDLDGRREQVAALLFAVAGELQRFGAQAGRAVGNAQADQIRLRRIGKVRLDFQAGEEFLFGLVDGDQFRRGLDLREQRQFLAAVRIDFLGLDGDHVAIGFELAVGQDAAYVFQPDAGAIGLRVVGGGDLLDGGAVDVAAVRGGAFGGDAEELGFRHGGVSRLIG